MAPTARTCSLTIADYRKFEWLLGDAARTNRRRGARLLPDDQPLPPARCICPRGGTLRSDAVAPVPVRTVVQPSVRPRRPRVSRSIHDRCSSRRTSSSLTVWPLHPSKSAWLSSAAKRSASYRWSSLGTYLGRRSRHAAWLCTTRCCSAFGGDVGTVPTNSSKPMCPATRHRHREAIVARSVRRAIDVEPVVDSLARPLPAILAPPSGSNATFARMLAITLGVELRVAPVTGSRRPTTASPPGERRTIARTVAWTNPIRLSRDFDAGSNRLRRSSAR